MRIATIICHRNLPDLVDRQVEQIKIMSSTFKGSNDIFVISAGSEYEYESKYRTHWYPDPDFRGKCYAHNFGLNMIGTYGYNYIWFNHPDLDFSVDMECLQKLINCMEANPEIAVLSPIHSTHYIGKNIRTAKRWHKAGITDYLSLLVRKECLEKFGFLNKVFKYCWGAICEYSYWIYSQTDWCIAYCENAKVTHFGGTTYGKGEKRISRGDYLINASGFGLTYLREKYGDDWTQKFFDVLPDEVKKLKYDVANRSNGKFCSKCKNECVEAERGRVVCKHCKKTLSEGEYYLVKGIEMNPFEVEKKSWRLVGGYGR